MVDGVFLPINVPAHVVLLVPAVIVQFVSRLVKIKENVFFLACVSVNEDSAVLCVKIVSNFDLII